MVGTVSSKALRYGIRLSKPFEARLTSKAGVQGVFVRRAHRWVGAVGIGAVPERTAAADERQLAEVPGTMATGAAAWAATSRQTH